MKNLLLQKVDAVLKMLAIRGSASMHELSSALDIPLSTLSRLTNDLAEMKLVEKIDYHNLGLGSGLIRYGECSRSASPLLHQAVPRLTDFSKDCRMNVLMAGFDNGMMFPLYTHIASSEQLPLDVWESGLAIVLLAKSDLPQAECFDLYNRHYPDSGAADRLIFEHELDEARNNQRLFRVNTMRQWSCSMPLFSPGLTCGICFYGKAPANRTMERFSFDCTLLVSRINSALNKE